MSAEACPPFPSRLRARHWTALDAVLVTAMVVAGLTDGWRSPPDSGVPDWLPALLGVGAWLPLAVRRIWPLPVSAVVLVCWTASVLVSGARYPAFEVALAGYMVAARVPARKATAVLVLAVVAVAAVPLAPPPAGTGSAPGLLVTSVVLLGVAWALGFGVRQQRDYAVRLRELAAREAVGRERLRIARELHDVVAHGMSVIAVQAGVANYVVDQRPEEARRVLSSIEETSKAGLQELRHMLDVLRAGEEPEPGLRPAPGLDGLEALASRFRQAGLPVRVRITGTDRPLPLAADLALYRIVQEALTNVVRHAGPAEAEVLVEYGVDEVRLAVTDNGRGVGGRNRETGSGGHGITGMRERVAMFGGTLSVGPRTPPATGFRVDVRLPVTGVAR